MVRFDLSLITIASLSVLGVWSQSPPSPPHCVGTCSDSSAQNASCSSTDVNCICNSDVFANDVASCIISNCSTTDAAAAVGYFEALCSGATFSSVSLSGISSTGSFSTTASGSGSVTSTAPSSGSTSGSTSGSAPSSSPSSQSGLSSSTNSAEQSSVSSTTSGASQSSTSRITASSTSAPSATPSATPSTTPPVSHAVRDHTSMSFAVAAFAFVLAVALVAW
ncbi:hypothetical protein V8E52_009244 [Russula decolorans]